MDSNFSQNQNDKGSEQGQSENRSTLILHNDDHNSFEFVMETLEEVCSHTVTQAEQCATIAHYKGKCDILKGESKELRSIRKELQARGLTVTLE